MSSDSASSEVTYTSISSHGDPLAWAVDFFRLQEPDSPEAAPASPDYVPGPEEPEQAPLSPDYVPGPEYPEYLAPSDEEVNKARVMPSDIQHSAAYSDLRVLQIGIRAKVIENQVKSFVWTITISKHLIYKQAVMSSASSAVTYTSVYTDSEPGRAFWGADDEEISEGGILRVIVLGYDGLPIQPVAPPSPDYIPGPEDPQTPPVPQDEDECEPMFVQAHDPDYVPEPIYPEYIPLEDEHEFPAEEQPLPPVDLPTAESPGYDTKSDPEEYEDDETEDGSVDYLMDGGDDGDDDDGDSSRDDANDMMRTRRRRRST
ncbi:hypothetical protein Tco_0199060 [Tanacetum coccineum]